MEAPAGGGFASLRGKTNGKGRFEFLGLRTGDFELRASRRPEVQSEWAQSAPKYEWLLTPAPVSSLRGELELVFGEKLLELTIRDPSGQLVSPELGLLPTLRSGEVRAYVVPCSLLGRWLDPHSTRTPTNHRGPDGSVSFTVQAGEEYLVGVVSLEAGVQEDVVRVNREGTHMQHTVFVGPAVEPGTLRVRLVDEMGAVFEGSSEVVIQNAGSGTPLFSSNWNSTDGDFEVRLPPGPYDVTARNLRVVG